MPFCGHSRYMLRWFVPSGLMCLRGSKSYNRLIAHDLKSSSHLLLSLKPLCSAIGSSCLLLRDNFDVVFLLPELEDIPGFLDGLLVTHCKPSLSVPFLLWLTSLAVLLFAVLSFFSLPLSRFHHPLLAAIFFTIIPISRRSLSFSHTLNPYSQVLAMAIESLPSRPSLQCRLSLLTPPFPRHLASQPSVCLSPTQETSRSPAVFVPLVAFLLFSTLSSYQPLLQSLAARGFPLAPHPQAASATANESPPRQSLRRSTLWRSLLFPTSPSSSSALPSLPTSHQTFIPSTRTFLSSHSSTRCRQKS